MRSIFCFIVFVSSVFAAPGYVDYGGLGASSLLSSAPGISSFAAGPAVSAYAAPSISAYASPAISAYASAPAIAVKQIAAPAAASVSKTEYHISHPPTVAKSIAIQPQFYKTIQPAISSLPYQSAIQSAIQIPQSSLSYGHSAAAASFWG